MSAAEAAPAATAAGAAAAALPKILKRTKLQIFAGAFTFAFVHEYLGIRIRTSSLNKLFIRNVCQQNGDWRSTLCFTFSHTHTERATHSQFVLFGSVCVRNENAFGLNIYGQLSVFVCVCGRFKRLSSFNFPEPTNHFFLHPPAAATAPLLPPTLCSFTMLNARVRNTFCKSKLI